MDSAGRASGVARRNLDGQGWRRRRPRLRQCRRGSNIDAAVETEASAPSAVSSWKQYRRGRGDGGVPAFGSVVVQARSTRSMETEASPPSAVPSWKQERRGRWRRRRPRLRPCRRGSKHDAVDGDGGSPPSAVSSWKQERRGRGDGGVPAFGSVCVEQHRRGRGDGGVPAFGSVCVKHGLRRNRAAVTMCLRRGADLSKCETRWYICRQRR